jgi:ubiquitin-like protein Pup
VAEQAKRTTRTAKSQEAEREQPKARIAERGEKLKRDIDEIIDEIDEVLEENAEEFVKSYVQRGGE